LEALGKKWLCSNGTFFPGISLVRRRKTQKFGKDNQSVADNQPGNLLNKTSKTLSLEPKISAVNNEQQSMWKEEEMLQLHAPLVPSSYAEDKRRNLVRVIGGVVYLQN